MRLVRGLSLEAVQRLLRDRQQQGRYHSVEQLRRRSGISKRVIMQLADADAFSSFERDRRAALWEALAQERKEVEQPLFDLLASTDDQHPDLPVMHPSEQVEMDYRTAGLSLKGQPIMFWRNRLNEQSVLCSDQL